MIGGNQIFANENKSLSDDNSKVQTVHLQVFRHVRWERSCNYGCTVSIGILEMVKITAVEYTYTVPFNPLNW